MSLRLMSPLPARVIQVLQDYLPAELDLIDAEEADGMVTLDIRADAWFAWDKEKIEQYPACSIRTVSSTPTAGRAVGIQQDAGHADIIHRLDVMFHSTVGRTSASPPISPLELQKCMHRYVNGAMRVLCFTNWGLQTAADPVMFGSPNATTVCEWFESATYGPQEGQADGAQVRTAVLPLSIRRIEAR